MSKVHLIEESGYYIIQWGDSKPAKFFLAFIKTLIEPPINEYQKWYNSSKVIGLALNTGNWFPQELDITSINDFVRLDSVEQYSPISDWIDQDERKYHMLMNYTVDKREVIKRWWELDNVWSCREYVHDFKNYLVETIGDKFE